jgi:hypothetical protein
MKYFRHYVKDEFKVPIGTVNFVAPKFIWGKPDRDGQFCSPQIYLGETR